MRVRAVVSSIVVGSAVAAVPLTAHAAAATPSVSPVVVAGNGPLDLYRVTGSGFTPGHSVAFSLVQDGADTRPMASFPVAANGTVVPQPGYRIPLVAPGPKTLRMTQDDGVTADSPTFVIAGPAVTAPAVVQSGSPDTLLTLTGLANTSDVQRSVRVDGRSVFPPPTWFYDERTFSDAGVHTYLPVLGVGEHTITFTQTVRTPFTANVTVEVVPPTVTAAPDAGTNGPVPLRVTNAAYQDRLDVSVVGAAGDRHDYGSVAVHSDGGTGTVTLDGVSVGTATATFTSTLTGGRATATFLVLPSSVSAPGLGPDGRIVSPDGWLRLVMQSDGNLVTRVQGAAGWSTHTAGHPGARLVIQDDGNVVIRGVDGRALWSTGTAGTGRGNRVVVNEWGATLTTAGGRRLWSTFPLWQMGPLTAGSYVARDETREGDIVAGPHGPYGSLYLSMAADGNLSLRLDTGVPRLVWQTRTGGHPNAYAVLQSDGNFVVRGPDGRALWANNARVGAGARIVLQPDGNMVERAADGRAVWSTGTTVQRY